jgi:hypothetical protein
MVVRSPVEKLQKGRSLFVADPLRELPGPLLLVLLGILGLDLLDKDGPGWQSAQYLETLALLGLRGLVALPGFAFETKKAPGNNNARVIPSSGRSTS